MNGRKPHALGAALALAVATMSAQADSPSQRWQSWRQQQLSGAPDQAIPRLAWSFFGDGGIPADDSGFATYAKAGFTMVQTKLNPQAIETAEKQGLRIFLGTWEGAAGNDQKIQALAQRASSDNGIALLMLKDEADATYLDAIGHDNDTFYRSTPTRVLPIQTILPAHASKPNDKKRFDPTRPCNAPGSYCDFFRHVEQTAHPAAVAVTLYPLLEGGDRPGYQRELEEIRKLTETANIGMFGFVLVTPHHDGWANMRYKRPEQSDVMYQVNSLLANNAKGIFYYDYRIKAQDRDPERGAFGEALVSSADGQPTNTYGYVQRANCEIAAIGATLMGLDVRETFRPDERRDQPAVMQTAAGQVTISGPDLLVSRFEPHGGGGGGAGWVMVVNTRHGAGSGAVKAHLQSAAGTSAVLAAPDDACRLRRSPLVEHGGVDIEIPPGEGRLIEIKRGEGHASSEGRAEQRVAQQ